LPGCFSQGETIEKTKENIREAIEAYLDIDNENIEIGLEDEIHELAL
jgi:predicted RNase H-like HicB family nuclease